MHKPRACCADCEMGQEVFFYPSLWWGWHCPLKPLRLRFLISAHHSSPPDYYFKDIVTCSSTFEDPTKIESENRQRNLQYDVSFHDLEDGKRTVQLTSGDILNHWFDKLDIFFTAGFSSRDLCRVRISRPSGTQEAPTDFPGLQKILCIHFK